MSRRALGMLAEQTLGRWAVGVGAVLLAVSGVFGGWEQVEPPPAQAGTSIEGGAWKVTIHDARLVGELPPMKLSRKENHWIVVVATVEITAPETRKFISNIIQLPETEGIDNNKDGLTSARDVVLMRDATIISQLQPGMPEKVAFFWERKQGTPVPKELRVVVTAVEFRQNSLTFGEEWFPDELNYTVASVPVLDKRDANPSASPSASPQAPTTTSSPSPRAS